MKNQKFPAADSKVWKEEAEKSLKGKPLEKLLTNTYEGITLKPLYTSEDTKNLDHINEFPGFTSYKRGIKPLGNAVKSWEVSQELKVSSLDEANRIIKHDIERGLTMLNLVIDNVDSPINTLDDVRVLLDGIDLEKLPLFVDAGALSFPFVSLVATYSNETQVPLKNLSGTIGMDPIGTLVKDGTLTISLEKLYDLMSSTVKWSNVHTPQLRTVLVNGHPYHNGGANAVQELAYTIATAVEYIQEGLARGLSINDIAKSMTFSYSVGSNMFMEISKLRAARMLWTRIIEVYGGDKVAGQMYIHARTSAYTKTVYDPYVNMLRSTTEAFAAVIGGVNSLHVSTFDEPSKEADYFSRRIARNTQLILKEEAHLNKVVDPAGGSWYVESLTNDLAENAWALFQQVEEQGGILKALQTGFIQESIKTVAGKRVENVKLRKEKIVGTNFYANLSEKELKGTDLEGTTSKVITEVELAGVALGDYIDRIKESKEALLTSTMDLVTQGVALQELVRQFESTNNNNIQVEPIHSHRLAEPFEELRNAASRHKEATGSFPRIGLLNLGTLPMHKPRTDFITGFFEAGGFEVLKNEGYTSLEAAVKGYQEMDLSTVVVCGTDELYKEFVKPLSNQIKTLSPNAKIYVAGMQDKETEASFLHAGISGFIHMKSNCYEVLKKLQLEMGVAVDE
ncbi:acyl-CoA mutase large subunit family protein [Cytobacillus suaedae]|nr:acyl-CoA mutase large subunit family protein [Cytobacillus suaedae]